MKKILVPALVLVGFLVGCCSVTVVVDREVISRQELGRLIARHLGVGIVISIERESYEIIPSQHFKVLLKEFYPGGSPLDAAIRLKTLCQSAVPTGAVGIALFGSPNESNCKYWVVYLNEDKILYLVDPVSKDIVLWDWTQAEGAWVSF